MDLKSKRLIAVVTALLAVTLAVFGGRINAAVVHCREKYIDEPIARRVLKHREERQQNAPDLSDVIKSPLLEDTDKSKRASDFKYHSHRQRGVFSGPVMIPTE